MIALVRVEESGPDVDVMCRLVQGSKRVASSLCDPVWFCYSPKCWNANTGQNLPEVDEQCGVKQVAC